MASFDFDVIVIGAGLGGLAAAATVACAGRRVLVLEQHSVPGGYAHAFRRGRYRFEVSLHMMDGVAPGGFAHGTLERLGVLDDVAFVRLDPIYEIRDGTTAFSVPADRDRYARALGERHPGEADGLRRLFAENVQVFREVRAMEHAGAPTGHRIDPERDAPRALRAMSETWANALGRHGIHGRARDTISALWHGFLGLPPSRLNAAAVALPWASYHELGAYYPRGGSEAISRAIERVITRRGGVVSYRRRVTRIATERGRARAVATADGAAYSARSIVSNASPPQTMFELLDRTVIPPRYAERTATLPPSLSIFTVYLGLDRSTARVPPHHIVLRDATRDVEADHQATLRGEWHRVALGMTCFSHLDETCAPPGCTVLALSCLAPWDFEEVWGTQGVLEDYAANPRYRAIKARVAGVLLGRAAEHVPGLEGSIRHAVVATPLTHFRYTSNPRGAAYGYEHATEAMYGRRPGARTPLANLFLAGAWTNPGGGQSAAMLSGEAAGRMALAACGANVDGG